VGFPPHPSPPAAVPPYPLCLAALDISP